MLGHLGRLKILRVLAASGFRSQTRYGLERATGMKPAAVRGHLKVLVDFGLVKELGLIPMVYQINDRNALVISLVEFFRKTGYVS
ncbi:winged helix-turn-helix domain-containing protein [Candidatus Bathyarchaeota archaeon]|nr:winged helix-turn-helix domain-containing protein [Candidatus Bathyarchaeota archaeon]